MLHLVLDTTVMRSDPARKKAAFKSLERLAKFEKVQVYIPYVVKHEFLTQEEDSYQLHLQNILSKIQDLQKKPLPELAIKLLHSSIESFEKLKPEMTQFAEREFQLWCEEINVQVLPVDKLHGEKIIESYFKGKLPFKKKKNRDDFPDAFVWQAIYDLSKKLPEIYVVTNDTNFGNAITTHKNITLLKNLDDFIKLEVCQKLIQDIEFIELEEAKEINNKINFYRFINLISSIQSPIIYSMESALLGEFEGTTVKSYDIPDDNHTARVDYLGNIEELKFHTEQVSYYGSDTFVIPFSVTVEAQLSYFIHKADYCELDEEKTDGMSILDWNDHVYSVDEDYSLAVEGRMSIMFDSDILEQSFPSDEDLIYMIKDAEIRIAVVDKVSVLPQQFPE
jgi:rRNA-processing protein FCF1